jgi:hypothetical protein
LLPYTETCNAVNPVCFEKAKIEIQKRETKKIGDELSHLKSIKHFLDAEHIESLEKPQTNKTSYMS